jgi:DNA gyrase subunit B
LPLKGKILNVERARFDKMLSSQEVGTLITAIGTGIGREEFNADKARYHKIIIMTDADVDGSHIRTLLLTFFYRQMPELIERGYLYIAQPPLYKIKRGSSEKYLKNDAALEAYLIDAAAEDAELTHDGKAITGDNLRTLMLQAKQFAALTAALTRRVPLFMVEAAAMAGVFSGGALSEFSAVLNRYSPDGGGWVAEKTDAGISVTRTVRSVVEHVLLDEKFLTARETRELAEMHGSISKAYANTQKFLRKSYEASIHNPGDLYRAVVESGKKGATIQRFKGLGEMNPDQLWETTLDDTKRTLLRVTVHDAADADEAFSTLMGDIVEPRRDFIQTNALKAAIDA